jgi:hypothetical protein
MRRSSVAHSIVIPDQSRALIILAFALAMLVGCQPPAQPDSASSPKREAPSPTPLPTRQTTIDPVNRKLDAAQQETERRRNEVDRATQ